MISLFRVSIFCTDSLQIHAISKRLKIEISITSGDLSMSFLMITDIHTLRLLVEEVWQELL